MRVLYLNFAVFLFLSGGAEATCITQLRRLNHLPGTANCPPTYPLAQSGSCLSALQPDLTSGGHASPDGNGWMCERPNGAAEHPGASSLTVTMACCESSTASASAHGQDNPAGKSGEKKGDEHNDKVAKAETIQTTAETQDRIAESLNNQTTIANLTDASALSQARNISQSAESVLIDGVKNIAEGVAILSDAEQAQKDTGTSEDIQKAKADALYKIAYGTQSVEKAHLSSSQAQAVTKTENRLGVGVGAAGSTGASTSASFSRTKFEGSAKKALDQMEDVAGVSARALVDAAKANDIGQIYDLVGGAEGVSMSPTQVAEAMQEFAASRPSAPTQSFSPNSVSHMMPLAQESRKAAMPLQQPGQRHPAVEPAKERSLASDSESISTLGTDYFMQSLGTPMLDEAKISLFQRVHDRIQARSPELKR